MGTQGRKGRGALGAFAGIRTSRRPSTGALALSAELRGINAIMTDFYDDPDFVAELMDFRADVAIGYMRVQIDAGAHSIGMSDAAASMIGPEFYEAFPWPRQLRKLSAVRDMGAMTRLHMCGRTEVDAIRWIEDGDAEYPM